MELNDIRRKIHVLESFEISDVREVILRDPRILRRPAHHIRKVMEILDDWYVTNTEEIITNCPHFLASTSKMELCRRLKWIDNNVTAPRREIPNDTYRFRLGHVDKRARFSRSNSNVHEPKPENWSFIESSGDRESIRKSRVKNEWHDVVTDARKRAVADFLEAHPSMIGHATAAQMNTILVKLRSQLRIRDEELGKLLEEYPEILIVSPLSFDDAMRSWKRNGIRNLKKHLLSNPTELLFDYAGTDKGVPHDIGRHFVFAYDAEYEEEHQFIAA
jgi:hypothetical protein